MKSVAVLIIVGSIIVLASDNSDEEIQSSFEAEIHVHQEDGKNSSCIGTIISDQWILTSADCVDNIGESVEVFVGYRAVSYTVPKENVIKHHYYTPSTNKNNIAVIKLTQKLRLNANIEIVKIPKFNTEEEELVGSYAFVPGWVDPSRAYSTARVLTTILRLDTCKLYYNKINIHRSHLCVDSRLFDWTCPHQSGAPLILDKTNRQVGIFSHETLPCQLGVPSVFTRLSVYSKWIANKTGVKGD